MCPRRLSCDAALFNREMELLSRSTESSRETPRGSARGLVRSRAPMDLKCIQEEREDSRPATNSWYTCTSVATSELETGPARMGMRAPSEPEQIVSGAAGADAKDAQSRWSMDSAFSVGTMCLPADNIELDGSSTGQENMPRSQSIASTASNVILRAEYSYLVNALDLDTEPLKHRNSASNSAAALRGVSIVRLPRDPTRATMGGAGKMETRAITLPLLPRVWKLDEQHTVHEAIELDDLRLEDSRSHAMNQQDDHTIDEAFQLDSVMDLFLASLKLVEEPATHSACGINSPTSQQNDIELADMSFRQSSAIFLHTPTSIVQASAVDDTAVPYRSGRVGDGAMLQPASSVIVDDSALENRESSNDKRKRKSWARRVWRCFGGVVGKMRRVLKRMGICGV